jgi:hypothetical protein
VTRRERVEDQVRQAGPSGVTEASVLATLDAAGDWTTAASVRNHLAGLRGRVELVAPARTGEGTWRWVGEARP